MSRERETELVLQVRAPGYWSRRLQSQTRHQQGLERLESQRLLSLRPGSASDQL